MFNVFWYTHHLFIIYFIMCAVHGVLGLLEPPTFYLYTALPGLLYLIERSLRICRGNKDTILQLAVAHPSKVLELQMKKSDFNYKPGQYLFLNCPYIASQEWHPFTITSAPEEDFVSVHIRVASSSFFFP
jgi:predicted ferric reductase